MVSETENELLNKIRDSEHYKSAMSNLRSKYENVNEESSYMYKPENIEQSYSIVVIRVSGSASLNMNLIFKIDDAGEVIDAEAEVDALSGVGEPKKVDEYLKRKSSIKDRIKSLRDNKED